jgi:predicted DCC family thiol-disulfide oxidoreductase YuxK
MIDTDQLAEDQLPERTCLLLYDGGCRLCVFAKSQIDQLRVG